MSKSINRRELNVALINGVVGGAIGLHSAPSEAMASKLDPSDPIAVNLGYVEDAKKVDTKKFPAFKPGQTCDNCALVLLRYGFYRPCKLFPKNLVSAKGWCSGWVQNANR